MRWFQKDLKSTLSALLTVSTLAPPSPEEQAEKLDELRREMLALAVLTETNRSEVLARRIRYAIQVETLWYARGELMGQLARGVGEQEARQKVDALDGLFAALLPRGLRSRPSRLDGSYRSSRPGF